MKNWFGKYKEIITAISLTLVVFSALNGMLWANYLNPRIDKRIQAETGPLANKMERIEEELIFINCQFSVTLPDSLKKQAEDLFDKAKRLGGR